MKILYAFYSFEGNCCTLARAMSEATGGELLALEPLANRVPRGFLMKYLKGGKSSVFKETPELTPYAAHPRDYDFVFVGGPVWAWNMAPPVRTFIMNEDWAGVKTAVFAMHRGGPGSVLQAMADLIAARGGDVRGRETFKDLRWGRPDETRARAIAWAQSLL